MANYIGMQYIKTKFLGINKKTNYKQKTHTIYESTKLVARIS